MERSGDYGLCAPLPGIAFRTTDARIGSWRDALGRATGLRTGDEISNVSHGIFEMLETLTIVSDSLVVLTCVQTRLSFRLGGASSFLLAQAIFVVPSVPF
jgi:hypothetical protein